MPNIGQRAIALEASQVAENVLDPSNHQPDGTATVSMPVDGNAMPTPMQVENGTRDVNSQEGDEFQ